MKHFGRTHSNGNVSIKEQISLNFFENLMNTEEHKYKRSTCNRIPGHFQAY